MSFGVIGTYPTSSSGGGSNLFSCFDGTNIWTPNNTGLTSATLSKLRAADGSLIGEFPIPGTDGASPQAFGICFDGSDLWVAQYEITPGVASPGVAKFDTSGASLGQFLATPSAVFESSFTVCEVIAAAGSIWLATGVSILFNWSGLTEYSPAGVVLGNLVEFDPLVQSERDDNSLCFDGANIWLCNRDLQVIHKVTTAGTILGSYATGNQSLGCCFDGTNVWVTNQGDGTVTKITAATGAIVGTYAAGSAPTGICFDGTSIWIVGNSIPGTLTEIDPATGAILSTITLPKPGPWGVTWDGASLWVSNTDGTITKLGPVPATTSGVVAGTFIGFFAAGKFGGGTK